MNSKSNKTETRKEGLVPINGFQQVLEMLRIADPAFRESLLKRLAQKDLTLADSLRRDLANLDQFL